LKFDTENICSFILLTLLCISCSRDNLDNNDNDSKNQCFCDSTYFNHNDINEKEFLCYKGNRCYKLVVKGDKYKMTEHYLEIKNYSYQRIIMENEQIIDSMSSCFLLNIKDSNILMKYIGPKVDSLNICILSSNNQRTKIKQSLFNDFALSTSFFENDTNKIVFDIYFSSYLEIESKKGIATTLRTIPFSPFKPLKENSFDTLLSNTIDCMRSKSIDTRSIQGSNK
jgi:hypothetical protein